MARFYRLIRLILDLLVLRTVVVARRDVDDPDVVPADLCRRLIANAVLPAIARARMNAAAPAAMSRRRLCEAASPPLVV